MSINNQDRKKLYKKLLTACKVGDSSFVKEVINSGLDNQINEPVPSKMIEHASGYGYLEIIQAIYESEHLKKQIDNETTLKESTEKAFQYGHIEIVKFLVPKLDTLGGYNDKIVSNGISDAIMNGKLNIVKILIENPPIKTTLNRDFFIDKAMNLGSIYDRVDIVKYAMEIDNFQYFNKDKDNLLNTFWGALCNGSMNIIKYFIFDLKVEKNQAIESLLNNQSSPDYEIANHWFNIRDNLNSLEEELPTKDSSLQKKMKL